LNVLWFYATTFKSGGLPSKYWLPFAGFMTRLSWLLSKNCWMLWIKAGGRIRWNIVWFGIESGTTCLDCTQWLNQPKMFLQHLISPNLYSFNLLLLKPNVALWSQPNVHTSGPSVAGRQRATKHLHWEFGPLWDGYVRTKVSWNIQMLNYVWRHLDIPDISWSWFVQFTFPIFSYLFLLSPWPIAPVAPAPKSDWKPQLGHAAPVGRVAMVSFGTWFSSFCYQVV